MQAAETSRQLTAYRQKLDAFVASLEPTDIWFLCFTRKGAPKLRAKLGAWQCPGGPACFVAPGMSSGWCYVHLQSTLAYLVLVHTTTGEVRFADHREEMRALVANHGDHLTVGVGARLPSDLLLHTHFTMYSEIVRPEIVYERTEVPCTLLLTPSGVDAASLCVPKKVPGAITEAPPQTLWDAYQGSPVLLPLVTQLGQILVASSPSQREGGGPRRASYVFRGARRRVQTGPRGGQFVVANGRRCYLPRSSTIQRGGASLTYKTVSFSDDFVAFLGPALLDPVFAARPDLEEVTLLFDERAQLGPGGNRFLVFLYDFDIARRHIFYVPAEQALIAYFAHTHPATATVDERAAEAAFQQMAGAHVARLVRVAAG